MWKANIQHITESDWRGSRKAIAGEIDVLLRIRLGIRVLIGHTLCLVDSEPPETEWVHAELQFAADVKDIGAELLDHRDELLFTRADLFDSNQQRPASPRAQDNATIQENVEPFSDQ